MSIVIRHGSNGAMKTATAVDAYIIPAAKEGRVVVTNVRGVTRERFYEKYPDLPESFDVINIDTSTRQGKEKVSIWFHWVPNGALLVFDEVSSLFPKKWRDTDINKLAYPGGEDAASEADRPPDWLTAWEMHRHYNWDIVLTTPNIKGVRDDIRGTTEMAYRHRSLGAISEKLRYIKEVQHDAQKNGFSASDAISLSTRRVSKDAFTLYDSTATGLHKGSKAGKSLFADPKVLLLSCIILGIVVYLGNAGAPSLFKEPDSSAVELPVAGSSPVSSGAPVSVRQDSGSPGTDAGRDVSVRQSGAPDPISDPFKGYRMTIVGSINDVVQIEASRKGDTLFLTPDVLSELGYSYQSLNDCMGKLYHGNSARLLTCTSNDSERVVNQDRFAFGSSGADGA